MVAQACEHKVIEATLCYLVRQTDSGPEVLLGLKKDGLWSGPGGKFQQEETIDQCVMREVEEEIGVGIDPCSTLYFASIDYYFPVGTVERLLWRVYFSLTTKWVGDPQILQEFTELRWFPISNLPFEQMKVDQSVWLPMVLHGSKKNYFVGTIRYADPEGTRILQANFVFY